MHLCAPVRTSAQPDLTMNLLVRWNSSGFPFVSFVSQAEGRRFEPGLALQVFVMLSVGPVGDVLGFGEFETASASPPALPISHSLEDPSEQLQANEYHER